MASPLSEPLLSTEKPLTADHRVVDLTQEDSHDGITPKVDGGWTGRMLMALHKVGESEEEVDVEVEQDGEWFSFRTLVSYCGPGFLMCIAYLDPGNLEADLNVGAYTGYSLVWVLFLATVMGLVLQVMAARLGVVTGKHLAQVCKENYSKGTSMTLWVMTELAIIGCDLQEIIGSATAFQVLFGWDRWIGCLITFLDTFTFLGIHYFGVRKLEVVFVLLVATMTICFFINFGQNPPPLSDVAGGFVPDVKPYAVLSAVQLVGAVIMPHNIFLHSALVLTRKIDRNSPRRIHEAVKYNTIDSSIALFISFLINLAVVSVFAHNFFNPTCAKLDPQSSCLLLDNVIPEQTTYGDCTMNGLPGKCQEIGLQYADYALMGALGVAAKYVWGVGLLAAGQSSTMSSTYAGQYICEGFLDLSVPVWARVTFTRLLAIGPGLVVAIMTEKDPVLSDHLQVWINIFQSIQLTFALLPVLHFTSSKRIMGQFKNSLFLTVVVWTMAIVVLAVNLYLVLVSVGTGQPWWVYMLVTIVGILYFAFTFHLIQHDIRRFLRWVKGRVVDKAGVDGEEEDEASSDSSSVNSSTTTPLLPATNGEEE